MSVFIRWSGELWCCFSASRASGWALVLETLQGAKFVSIEIKLAIITTEVL